MAKLIDYTPELDALKRAGYVVQEHVVLDYGNTLGVVVEVPAGTPLEVVDVALHRGGKCLGRVMFRECFYDTDEQGNRTKWHGVLDIRETPWSKQLRGAA